MKYGLLLLTSAVALHFVSEFLGIYDSQIASGFVWIDNVINVFVGTSVALCCISYVKAGWSKGFVTVVVLGCVFGFAFLWEFVEFIFFVFYTELATELKIYSPSFIEALIDIGSNMFGGVVLLVWKRKSS